MNRINHYIILLKFILLFLSGSLYANYIDTLENIFFGRQPSARSEAMGRSMDLLVFDGSSSFFNPANIARLEGISLYTSYASPYYFANKSFFTYYNLSASLGQYGSVALCSFDYNSGDKWTWMTENNEILGEYTYHETLYTLSYAKSIMEDLYIGANINLAQIRNLSDWVIYEFTGPKTYNAFPIDIGVIKQFNINLNENFNQKIGIGFSIFNILNSHFNIEGNINELPVLSRIGLSHCLGYNGLKLIDGLKSFNWLIHLEYQDLLNESKRRCYRVGSEISLLEIIFLRIGYYYEELNDHNSPDVNENSLSEITYGFGIQIPIKTNHLENFIRFDFARLEQPSYSKQFTKWDDFTVWNLYINLDLNLFR